MSWRHILKQIRPSLKRARLAPRPKQPTQRLVLEALENRTLLSITTQGIPLWTAEGPGPTTGAQVQNIFPGNPVTGAIQAIAAHPNFPNILYVATVNGGIWRTRTATTPLGDVLWTPLTGRYPSLSMGDIALSPLDPNVLYAGTARVSSGNGDGGPLNGLLRTTDAGDTWTMLGQNTFRGQNIVRIRPTSTTTPTGQVVLVASGNGVYRSTDGGVNWTQVPGPSPSCSPTPIPPGVPCLPLGAPTDLVPDPTNVSRFYVAIPGSAQGVFRTDDSGVNWVAATLPAGSFPPQGSIRMAVGMGAGGGIVYAATIGPCTPGQPLCQLTNVFFSTNVGASWTRMHQPGQAPAINPGNQAATNFSIAAAGTNVVFVGGDVQPRPFTNGCSTASGNHFRGLIDTQGQTTWATMDCDGARGPGLDGMRRPTSPHADSRAMALDANGDLLEADDGGIYKLINPNAAADLRRWVSVIGNLHATEFYSVAYDESNQTIFGGAQDTGSPEQTWVHDALGSHVFWQDATGADGAVVAVDNISLVGKSIHYVSTQCLGGRLNNGQCVGPAAGQGPNFRRRTFFNTMPCCESTLLQSDVPVPLNIATTSPVSTLFQVEANAVPVANTVQFVQPYVLNNVNPQRMIIGTSYLYESTDSGNTFTSVGGLTNLGGGNFQPNNPVGVVSAIAYGGRRGGVPNLSVLWLGAGGQLWLRTTGSGMPTSLGPFLGSPYQGGLVKAVQMDPTDWGVAYVLDNAGRVWRTTDQGATFTELTGNLCNLVTDLRTIEVGRSGSNVAVLVGGAGGVYRAVNPGTAVACSAATTTGAWRRYGGPRAVVKDLHLTADNNLLTVGTWGQGAWQADPLINGSNLFQSSILTVNGVANEIIRLAPDPNIPGIINIFENGQLTFTAETADLQQVIVNALVGNETVNIDALFAGLPVTINTNNTVTVNFLGGARVQNIFLNGGNLTLNGLTVVDGLTINAGTLTLPSDLHIGNLIVNSGLVTGSGLVTLSGDSTIAGTYNVSGSTAVTGGTVNFTGIVSNLGTQLSVSGGTVNFTNPNAFTIPTVVISGGTLKFSNPNPLEIPTVALSGGTLGGSATLTVTNLFTWTGGTLGDPGVTNLAMGAAFNVSGPGDKALDGRTLTNAGTAIWTDSGNLVGRNGALWNNQPGAIFDIRGNAAFLSGAGALSTFSNAGLVRKSAGAGTTAVNVTFTNAATLRVETGTVAMGGSFTNQDTGTVEVPAGALVLAGSGTSGGRFMVSAGAVLAFDAGTHTLTAGSTVTAAGTVRFAGTTLVSLAGTYTVTGVTRSLGGQANFNSNASAAQLGLEGGFIGGAATLTVPGAITWISGGYNGTGHLRADGGISLTGSAPKHVANGTLDNTGLAAWTDAGPLFIYQNGTWNNLPSGILEARNDAAMQGLTGPLGRFVNAGLFRKAVSTGSTTISVAVTNSGTFHVQTGTLVLDGPLTNLSNNTLTDGTFLVQTTLQITNADIRTNAASIVLDGVASAITRDGQRDDALANLAMNAAAGRITIRHGRGFTPAGNFDNAGLFTMEDTGTLALQQLTWTNRGQFQWFGSGGVSSQAGVRFDNLAGATFDVQGNATFGGDFFNIVFTNAGTATKSNSGGLTEFLHTTFTNSGAVEVQTGTLRLGFATSGASSGRFSAQAGAILAFAGSTHVLSASSSITGGGQVKFSCCGTVILAGNYAVTGITVIESGGTPFFFSATPVTIGNLTITSGTVHFDSAATVGSLTQTDGTLTGPGMVTVTGQTTWTGGTMSGTGRTVAQGGLLLGGASKSLVSRTLVNAGTAAWTAGDFSLLDGAVVSNPAGAVFDIQTDSFVGGSTSGVFNNAGALRKSAGTGITDFRYLLNNTGTVDVQTGTLRLNGGDTSTGGFAILAGATLEFSFGTHLLADSSSIAGGGRVKFSCCATATVAGSYAVTGPTVIDGGTASFAADASTGSLTLAGSGILTGPGTMTVAGVTTWTGGTMSGTGRTIALGGLQLSGPGLKFLNTRALDNFGAATWTGGDFFAVSEAVFSNMDEATFDIQTDAAFIGNGVLIFNNLGTLRKSAGTGVSEFASAVLNNSGAVEVQTGTLRLGGGGESTGSFTVRAGATLEFAGGVHLLVDTATIASDGLLLFTAGSVFYAGDLTLSGSSALVVGRNGTLTIAGTFTQTGGSTTLAGGTLAVGSGILLQGGTLSGSGQIIGDVTNAAAIVVGDLATVGTLTIAGNYTQTADGTLTLKLGGTTPGRFDRLVVSGTAALAGTLRVTLIDGYTPAAGDSFQLLVASAVSGTFDTLAGDGPLFDALYDDTGLTLRRP